MDAKMHGNKRDSQDHPGVLVISVWHEPGVADGFRSRLIASEPGESETTTSFAATPKEVIEAVQHWLDRMTPR